MKTFTMVAYARIRLGTFVSVWILVAYNSSSCNLLHSKLCKERKHCGKETMLSCRPKPATLTMKSKLLLWEQHVCTILVQGQLLSQRFLYLQKEPSCSKRFTAATSHRYSFRTLLIQQHLVSIPVCLRHLPEKSFWCLEPLSTLCIYVVQVLVPSPAYLRQKIHCWTLTAEYVLEQRVYQWN